MFTSTHLAIERPDVSARAIWAMGSDAQVTIVGGPQDLIDVAAAEIERLDSLWNRSRFDSEITRINQLAGSTVAVDPATALLVQRAVAAWHLTGRVVPSERLSRRRAGDIVVDLERSTVRIPFGTGFDPGGIGAGLAADIVVTMLLERGADGACVSLGEAVRVEGQGPAGGSWTVAVEHPHRTVPLGLITLSSGAVATATSLHRRSAVDGEPRRRLIGPGTGNPATTDIELMSVVAGQAWLAEASAAAGLLRGRHLMFDLLDDTEAALAVLVDGATVMTPSMEPLLVTLRAA